MNCINVIPPQKEGALEKSNGVDRERVPNEEEVESTFSE
jgi:hypothetical protein